MKWAVKGPRGIVLFANIAAEEGRPLILQGPIKGRVINPSISLQGE